MPRQVCESALTQLDLALMIDVGRTLYTICDCIGTRALTQWEGGLVCPKSVGFRVLWGKIMRV